MLPMIQKNVFTILLFSFTMLLANQPSFDCAKVKKDSSEGAILGETTSKDEKYSFQKTLSLLGLSFDIKTTGEGSLRQLTIIPQGLSGVNEVVNKEIDGMVVGAEVADLNKDGFAEVYVYVSSAGSGSYGSLVAYSSNQNKSMTSIYLPELSDDKKSSQGYMGHDQFFVVESSLERRFPVYNKNDSNANPTGGTRKLIYKLVPGEASWQLKLINSLDIK
jgi:hypothetical protein